MPTRAMETPTGAMNLRSFVHRVLEEAVKLKVESGGQLDDKEQCRDCGYGLCCGGLLFRSQVCYFWPEYPEKLELWHNAMSS